MLKDLDGSIIASDGRLLFCSQERFEADIWDGQRCFICGRAEADDVPFNEEHILPDWILRRFDLHGQTVTLPNGARHKYGSYTLPCCVDCNEDMSREFETPISRAFETGFSGVLRLIESGFGEKLFRWMVLIFLKYHLKDRLLRWHLDQRKGDEKIAARYTGELFHHLHAVTRAHHTDALLDDGVVGTFIVMSRKEGSILHEGRFDAATVTDGWTIYLQIEDVHLFAVLNDAGASASAVSQILDAIDGPLSSLQARELAAELAAANQHLENPPRFRTDVAAGPAETVVIRALCEGTGPRFAERDAGLIGEIKTQLLGRYFGRIEGMTADQVEREIRKDHYTFLLDAEGRFQRHGVAD